MNFKVISGEYDGVNAILVEYTTSESVVNFQTLQLD